MAASKSSAPALRVTTQARARRVLALFCLAVVGLLAAQVLSHGPMLELDRQASLYFAQHREPALTQAMRLVTDLHQTAMLLAATALIALWRGLRRDWTSVRALLVVPTGMLLNVGLKNSFQRPRPAWEDPLIQLSTYSFPSGHAVGSTVFYGMLCALVFAHTRSRLWRTVAATVAVAMVLLVCFSRIYLGAHYPTDVIAGIAVGTVWVLLFLRWARPGKGGRMKPP
jgi:membrane-associated phospholipid phosphatase